MNDFIPAEAFPPGEYIRDELKARGWTQKQFARVLGRPMKVVSEIINGRTSITPQTAMELSAAFGTSASVWLNLDTNYRLWKLRSKRKSKHAIAVRAKALSSHGRRAA